MVDDSEGARKQARALFEARLDRLETSGYLPVFEKMLRSMCAPFWWSSRDQNDPLAVVRQNGTICFVNTGKRRIGVTADHVYQGYLADKGRCPDVECQIVNNTIDPESRLIDRSPETQLDLATFDIPEVFLSQAEIHSAITWLVPRWWARLSNLGCRYRWEPGRPTCRGVRGA